MKRRQFIGTGALAAAALRATPAGRRAPPSRVDLDRREEARGICEYILRRMNPRGRYVPEESLYHESMGYRSSLAAYLALAGVLLEEKRYVDASHRMVGGLLEERIGDLWPVGYWVEYPVISPVSPLVQEQYRTTPDLRYSAIPVLALGLCFRATGDRSLVEPARRALSAIAARWDFDRQKDQVDALSYELLGLAIGAWEKELPEFIPQKQAICRWVLDTFVETAPKTMPFLTMYRTLLVTAESGGRHLDSHLRPGLDALLADRQWRCPQSPRDFFHIPKTGDHVNVRGNGAIAIALRAFDLAAGERVYTGGEDYRHVSAWMDGQRREDGAYYGCRDFVGGRRFCLGSPSEYLPLIWILGGAKAAV